MNLQFSYEAFIAHNSAFDKYVKDRLGEKSYGSISFGADGICYNVWHTPADRVTPDCLSIRNGKVYSDGTELSPEVVSSFLVGINECCYCSHIATAGA